MKQEKEKQESYTAVPYLNLLSSYSLLPLVWPLQYKRLMNKEHTRGHTKVITKN